MVNTDKIKEIVQSFKTDTDKHGKPNNLANKINKLIGAVVMEGANKPWISTKDELPKNGVLVYCYVTHTKNKKDTDKIIMKRDDDDWILVIGGKELGSLDKINAKVTHWQMLPDDPA